MRKFSTGLVLFLLAIPSSATSWYLGCFDCTERTSSIAPSSYCAPAREGETHRCGLELQGTEWEFCVIGGDPCLDTYYIPGTGSGLNCNGGPTGCPAECFSCSTGPRPRI
jgi:hypothetical protein